MIVFILFEVLIISLFLKALYSEKFDKNGEAKGQIIRGEKTMKAIYVIFTLALAVSTFVVSETELVKEYKLEIMAINCIVLIYLFFFNSWFRNIVFFKIKRRITRD